VTAYPPDEHILRDLRFTFEHDNEGRSSRAWMPIVPEACNDAGHVRAGVLAVLVDVIGGGLAASAASPDWIATADLTLHPGTVVEARASVLRAGRTTVVIEVALVDDDARDIGIASMSFSVLPRRDTNPDIGAVRGSGPSTMATPDARLRVPIAEMLDVSVVDGAAGAIDVPINDWGLNSMGAMQGGVVAMVADIAAETALRAASTEPLVVSDLQVTYLGFGRVGPVQSRVEVLGIEPGRGAARVELVDTGAERRLMTVVSAAATRSLS
jgi:acyl-coenzyme A thioesterase PaaI-like protein